MERGKGSNFRGGRSISWNGDRTQELRPVVTAIGSRDDQAVATGL